MKNQSIRYHGAQVFKCPRIPARRLLYVGMIGLMALVTFFGESLAQPQSFDTAIMFLVDESRSLTGGTQSYQERLYNSVYFMKEAIGQACQGATCVVGVSRFSERPVTLIAPKDTKHWGDPDLMMLEARPVDLNERTNYPDALVTACTNLPDATSKAIILFTDGNLRSEGNPNIAPVNGSVLRSRFIERISNSIVTCRQNGVKLYVLLIQPTGQDDDQLAFQAEEEGLWREWSASTNGNVLLSNAPDSSESVMQLIETLVSGLGLPGELQISHARDGEIDLGEAPGNLRSVDFNIVGLQPYTLNVNLPEGQANQDVDIIVRRNQSRLSVRLPIPGRWTSQVSESDDDNMFIVRTLVMEPLTFSLHLLDPKDQSEIVADSNIAIKLEVLTGERDGGYILGSDPIKGKLTDLYGSQIDIDFHPDPRAGVYQSFPFSDAIPSAGSYVLIVPSQVVNQVQLDELRAGFNVTDEPSIATWTLEPDSGTIEAGKTITLSVEIGNHQLLTHLPQLQVILSNDVDGELIRPPVTGDEYHSGEFKIPFTVPQPIGSSAAYEVRVRLVGDITKQGIRFPDKDSPTTRTITVLPVPTPQSAQAATPQPPVVPPLPVDPQLVKGALFIAGVYALVCLVVILAWRLAMRSGKPYRKFIMADQALGPWWIIVTWPYAKGFRNIRDSLSLTALSEQTTGNADEDNGINDVVIYLAKKFGLHAPKSLQKMKDWDYAFGAIRGGLMPNSPHNSIYRAGASQAITTIIEDCLVAHETGTSKEDTPTPADLYYDLLNQEFDPILPRHPQAAQP